MIIANEKKNRLLIYFLYDRDGIVDDYIPYMLEEMDKQVKDIFVVCNGKITPEGKEKLKYYTDKILERENKGFDVWAYKTAMESLGWEKLEEYDEIILMNYTIMGPVYPLSEMFTAMAEKDLDFWGVTKFHQADFDPFGTVPYGYLPDHIQTHFLVIRRSLLMTDAFRRYWEEMPMINSYQESVGRHEANFTKKFADLGYQWDVYADSEDYRRITYQPIIGAARQMLEEKRCPFFKRRSFMQDYTVVLSESFGQEAVELYRFLDENTDFDMNLFWDNILRVENQADIKKTLHLNYILPSDKVLNKDEKKEPKKIALIMHIYFKDLIGECLHYAKSMPSYADIYITTNTQEKKEAIEAAFSELPCHKLDVRLVPNKGRDVGPFLVESREYIMDYDYICHTHDKKVGQLKPGSIGAGFSYRCFENVLRSPEFVENIIDTMEKNPRIGLLTPPPPNHGPYYITLGMEWGLNYQVTKELAEKLDIHVPITDKKEPIAPLGSVFWARTEALKKVFDYPWTYEELPEEPIADDGTILHGIERIYNYSAQAEGYYPGWLFCEQGAAIELTNMYHMLRTVNEKLFYKANIAGSHQEMLFRMDEKFENYTGGKAEDVLHGKLYFAGETEELKEVNTLHTKATEEGSKVQWLFSNMERCGMVRNLRFDPGEEGNLVLENVHIRVVEKGGIVKEYSQNQVTHNGLPIKEKIVYLALDPQIYITLPEAKILESVGIEAKIEKRISGELAEKIKKKFMKKKIFE